MLSDHLSHPFPLMTTYLDAQSLVSEDSFLLSKNRVHECRTKVVDQGDFLLCECLSVRLGPDCRWGGGARRAGNLALDLERDSNAMTSILT